MRSIPMCGRDYFISIILFLLIPLHAGLQAQDFSPVARAIEKELADQRAPGAAIAIVKDGKVVYSKAFGVADVESGRILEVESLFRSASTLKMMVGAALVELHVQKRIDLHATISTYINGLHPEIGRLTTHQLLTHTSGLLDTNNDDGSRADNALRNRMLRLAGADVFLPTGAAFSYSNPGYNLAGLVLESVMEKPFRHAMQEVLFDPLGMTDSTFELDRARASGAARPHSSRSGQLVAMHHTKTGRAEEPSGTMFSSVQDYARFMTEFVSDIEKRNSPPVLSDATVKLLSSSRVSEGGPVTSYSYSYGLMVGQFEGYNALFHSGGMPGYAANVLMFPAEKIGIVLFVNGNNLDRNRVLKAAVNVLLPDVSQRSARPERATYPPVQALEAQDMIGTYLQRSDLPMITIYSQDGQVLLRNRGRDYILHHYGKNEFIGFGAEGTFQRYRIGRNATGKVTHLQWWIRAFARED